MDNPEQAVAILEQTPLAASLHAMAAAEYCGVLTIPSFDGTPCETDALTRACGIFDCGFTSRIRVSGEDCVRWLNGMVTNSAQSLQIGALNYNFVLNAQGRIQGDLFAFRRADDFVLQTTRDQRDVLLPWFDRYIIMDDVELASLDADLTAIGVTGPTAAATLEKTGISANGLVPDSFIHQQWNETQITLSRTKSPLVPQFEIWIDPAKVASLWAALMSAGAIPCGSRALETLRILTGTPRYGIDILSRDLPQETNQANALHFAKGCYLGQEIVERIRSRGSVHRSFTGFLLAGPIPSLRTQLKVDGKPVGELTSTTVLPDGRRLALGYARRELVERAALFHYESGTARATPLPFQLSLK